ncbi:MAG: hypothetical protein U5Q03_18165 [Bacteroidota bacterium]|nr:hypothetical protein [Bacteroidota bacterium]
MYENIQDLDALGGDNQYNGNISGMRWQGAENEGVRAYAFAYDKLNRVLGANYGEDISGSWVDKSDFDVYGNFYALQRKYPKP